MSQGFVFSSWCMRACGAFLLLVASLPSYAQEFGPPSLLSDSLPNNDTRSDQSPQVTTDGAGHWIATWVTNGGIYGTDGDILVARSTDNGATWSSPLPILPLNGALTGAVIDTAIDTDPNIATDGLGNWILSWSRGELGEDYDLWMVRSTDNGLTWTSPGRLNTNGATDLGHDFGPRVVSDRAGHWVGVWSSKDKLGGTLGGQEEILVTRSSDNGSTWSAPAALNSDAITDPVTRQNTAPELATDGAGHWVACWTHGDDSGYSVRTARSSDNGVTWTAPAALNANSSGLSPQVVTDGSGHWIVSWTTADDLGGTIGNDGDVVFARSSDNGATWTATAVLDGTAATDTFGDGPVHIATDGAGRWLATWLSVESVDPYVAYRSMIARSTDDGATWSPPVFLHTDVETSPYGDDIPSVSTDGSGNWVAVWSSTDSLGGTIGSDSDILVSRGGLCGDGVINGAESCDDGGVVDGDCCDSSCQVETCDDADVCTVDSCDVVTGCHNDAAPLDASSCYAAPGTKVLIQDSTDPSKDRLLWQWSKGEAFGQVDLGTPRLDTSYTLCIYDTAGSIPQSVAALHVPASDTAWRDRAPKGFDYRSADGAPDGVTRLQIGAGAAGSTKLKLSASGAALSLPGPIGGTYFHEGPKVLIQLRSSAGRCWSSEFTAADTAANGPTGFKAATR